jgi:translation initiation factor 2 subunit 2
MEELEEFNLSLKKKKKKTVTTTEQSTPHEESDDDYLYVDLLTKFFERLRIEHPALAHKTRAVVPLPLVYREGTKKTGISNYASILSSLNRKPEHLQSYMMTELSTQSSIDAKTCLILKGRFSQKQLTSVLEKYIIEYVSCKGCKSHHTVLTKDPITRLVILTCEQCKASRSVDQIKM